MKLTIVRSDGLVIKNGTGYGDIDMASISPSIHAVQWLDEAGQIEFVVGVDGIKPENEEITSLEPFQAVIAQWDEKDYNANHPPEPTLEQKLIACSVKAKMFLKDTDWSQLEDVKATLQNKAEFDAYRAILREYVINPVTNPKWPVVPTAVWVAA